jgi:hypothetical protein
MMWPASTQARGAEVRRIGTSRMNHPSVRDAAPDPTVILRAGHDLVDVADCGNACGDGVWCDACRADIRSEALRWLRELNVPRSPSAKVLSWSRAWHQDILLADR